MVELICYNCKKQYQIPNCRKDNSRFCSLKCNTEYRSKHPEDFGGFKKGHKGYKNKPWLGKKMSEKTKQKISDSMSGRRLTKEHREKLRGSNHHNWKGGKTSINNRIRGRHQRELHEWKMKVLKRDDFTCQVCDRNDIDVFAHHKEFLTEFNPETWFNVDNGLTVCRSCHKKLHLEIGKVTQFKAKNLN